MSKNDEHSKLLSDIKDGEARVKLLNASILAVENELGMLNIVLSKLNENIRCLKEQKIVAMAQEYKKAKEELAKTTNRIEMLSHDKMHFDRVHRDLLLNIEKSKQRADTLEKTKDNNVLRFKGKKDGQK